MIHRSHFRYPNTAKAIFCSLFGIFVAFLFTIAIFIKFTPAYDVMHSLGTDIYIAPWTRVLPYLIGVAAGYAMFTCNGVMPLGEVSRNRLSHKWNCSIQEIYYCIVSIEIMKKLRKLFCQPIDREAKKAPKLIVFSFQIFSFPPLENHQNCLDFYGNDRNMLAYIDDKSTTLTFGCSSIDHIHSSLLSSINFMDDCGQSNGSRWSVGKIIELSNICACK